MAKITAPNEEFTGKRGNVGFIDGVAETDDPTMIAYFRRHGYGVEDGKKASKKDAGDQSGAFPEGEPVESWTADQLKAYAAANEVDLGGATKKADIFAAITAHQG